MKTHFKALMLLLSFPAFSASLSDTIKSIRSDQNHWECYWDAGNSVANCSSGFTKLDVATRKQLGKREGGLAIKLATDPSDMEAKKDLAEVRAIQAALSQKGKVIETFQYNDECTAFHNLNGKMVNENVSRDICDRLERVSRGY